MMTLTEGEKKIADLARDMARRATIRKPDGGSHEKAWISDRQHDYLESLMAREYGRGKPELYVGTSGPGFMVYPARSGKGAWLSYPSGWLEE